jgi:hypothetical protein
MIRSLGEEPKIEFGKMAKSGAARGGTLQEASFGAKQD